MRVAWRSQYRWRRVNDAGNRRGAVGSLSRGSRRARVGVRLVCDYRLADSSITNWIVALPDCANGDIARALRSQGRFGIQYAL